MAIRKAPTPRWRPPPPLPGPRRPRAPRASFTPLEKAMRFLHTSLDEMDGMADMRDELPAWEECSSVRLGLRRLTALIPGELPRGVRRQGTALRERIEHAWAIASGEALSEDPFWFTWSRGVDDAQVALDELADLVGAATGRPSALKGTPEEVEALLRHAVRSELRNPGDTGGYFPDLGASTRPGITYHWARCAVDRVLTEGGLDPDAVEGLGPKTRLRVLEAALDVVTKAPDWDRLVAELEEL